MRVSRQWNDLLLRKRFGYGHAEDASPTQASLALFCPACPQPGINLPDTWMNEPRYGNTQCQFFSYLTLYSIRWIYRRNIVVDGNFSLEHMKMKKDIDDVCLSDGEGYMVQWMPYKQHLDLSIEGKYVCIILDHSFTYFS
jgi:hypothetical protein